MKIQNIIEITEYDLLVIRDNPTQQSHFFKIEKNPNYSSLSKETGPQFELLFFGTAKGVIEVRKE